MKKKRTTHTAPPAPAMAPAAPARPPFRLGRAGELILVAIGLALMVAALYTRLFDASSALQAGDAPPLTAHTIKGLLADGFFVYGWNPFAGLGNPLTPLTGDWQILCYLWLPYAKVAEAIMAIAVLLTGFFFYLFLRERGYDRWAALSGAAALSLSTAFVSLSFAGHLGKFLMMAYAAGALWTMEKALRKGSWLAAGFAGLFIGYVLISQLDAGLLILIGCACCWLRDLIAYAGRSAARWRASLVRLLVAGVIAVALAAPITLSLLSHSVAGAGSVLQDTQRHWEWATQWSLPTSEALRLVCAKFFGIDSWNAEAPYWGGMGRDAAWNQTHQGFRNFTQTSEYLGVVVVALALAAVFAFAWRRRRLTLLDAPGSPPADTGLWCGITVVSVLLCFGKHFPLYRLFYALPMMSSFRVPVKFIHLTSFAVAILAAQGATLIGAILRGQLPAGDRRRFAPAAAAALLTLLFLILLAAEPWTNAGLLTRLKAEGFEAQLTAIAAAMQDGLQTSLGLSILMLAVGLVILARAWFKSAWTRSLALLVVLAALVGDLLGADHLYVHYDSAANLYPSNGVIDYLRQFPAYRVKFMPPQWGIFNNWNTVLTTYYRIRSPDVPAMARPPADLEAFFSALSGHPARLWQLTGARHLVLPREWENQVQTALDHRARLDRGFTFVQDGAGHIATRWAATGEAYQFAILENTNALACPTWYNRVEWLEFDAALQKLADPDFDPAAGLLLDAHDRPTAAAAAAGRGIAGASHCRLVSFADNRIVMESDAPTDGWLFVNDYYDPAWQGFVDGHRTPVVRADGIFRALAVPAGRHNVEMVYRPNTLSFWSPFAVLGALLAIGVATLAYRRRQGGSTPAGADTDRATPASG